MYIERIIFERTGGFAGIRLAADIEVNELPEDEKHEILELLDDMDFDELPEKLSGSTPMPDGFVYSITVISNKKEYKVLADESSVPNDMQPLIEILENMAKRQMRKK
jgi:hypothetical protein